MSSPAAIENYPVTSWTKVLPRACLVDRDETIAEICRGKEVFHVGAADAPFDLEKGQRGELLHQKIQQVASRIVGVDIDEQAVEHLRALGINDIFLGDIINDPSIFAGDKFDVVLCCDVIEHVTNPGGLLAACSRYMRADTRLVVTTINATALKPALRALVGRESVHHDHTCYYSYATMCQLLIKCRLLPISFGVFSYPTVQHAVGAVIRRIMKARPGSADGILAIAKLEEAA
jgi:SAM-dependent methyltransferase